MKYSPLLGLNRRLFNLQSNTLPTELPLIIYNITKNQVSNGELHAFARLSLLRGFTAIFSCLKHNGLSSPLY